MIVKAEDPDVKLDVKLDVKPKSSSKSTNADLPVEWTQDGLWRFVVICIIRHIATTNEVFTAKDRTLINALVLTCSQTYGVRPSKLNITPTHPAFRLVRFNCSVTQAVY